MKKLLILFIFLFYHFNVFAQDYKDYSQLKHSIFTGAMTSLLSLYQTNLDIGYERKFLTEDLYSPYFALEGAVGIVLPYAWNNDADDNNVGRSNSTGYLFRIMPKYIFPRTVNTYFVASSNYYIQQSYESTRYQTEDFAATYTFDVNSKVIGSNLVIGYREDLVFDRFFMEGSIGFGLKYYWIENNAPVPVETMSDRYRTNSYLMPEANGNHLRWTIPLNFKFGIRF